MKGKIALNEQGALGLITSNGTQMAFVDRRVYVGIHLTGTRAGSKPGHLWISENPRVVGTLGTFDISTPHTPEALDTINTWVARRDDCASEQQGASGNSCNHHVDCAAADAKAESKGRGKATHDHENPYR